MSQTAIELKPCPFCGSDELSHGYSSPPTQGSVQCHQCGGAMIADDEDDAIEAWNQRFNAALASLSHTMGVKVRELEWVQEHPRHHHADSIVADYGVIGVTANTNYRLYRDTFEIPCPDGHYWPFEAAKAAAQADYEQRIRSALTPTRYDTHVHIKNEDKDTPHE